MSENSKKNTFRHLSPVTYYLRRLIVCISFIGYACSAQAASLIRDAEIEHTLRVYADPIFRAANLKPSAVKLFIVGDDALNAFVAGGANMFIHTGLILETETPDMLIGVMAHETGHIAGGHLARGAEKMRDAQLGAILTMIAGAAAGAATGKGDAATAIIAGGQTSLMRNVLAYTRAHEEAADQAALSYLDKTGMSAEGMLKTFTLLQRRERLHSSSPDPYMRSHPLSSQRMEHMRAALEKSRVPQGQYPKSYDQLHKRMVAKLYGFLKTPERTLQKYPVGDKSIAARMARAVAYYKMPDITRSMQEIDALTAELPDDPFIHDLKGQILFENGRITEALQAYRKAHALMPGSPLILTDLAKVELAQDKPDLQRSIGYLEKANSMDNTNPYAWRLLATAYGKTGEMGKSSLALAEEAILNGKPEEALTHASRAVETLKEGSPARQRAQDVKALAIEMQREKKEAESIF